MNSIDSKFRYDIEGLRALAVLLVILFHLDFNFFSGGFIGVDVFFVISGYLITKNIMQDMSTKSFSFKLFYYKRARRLLPALYVTIFATLIAGFLLLNPLEFINLAKSAIATVLSVVNMYFWQDTDYFDKISHIKPLLNMWSLAVEEQFYFFWPLILLLLYKVEKTSLRLGIMVLVLVLSIFLTGVLTKEHQVMSFFLMPFRVSEFMFGALIAAFNYKLLNNFLKEIVYLLGLILIIYAAIVYNPDMLFPGFYVLIPALGTALVIFSGENKYSSLLLRNKVMLIIGASSYSVYLWHWPLIVYSKYIFTGELSLTIKIILVFVSLLLGYLSFKYVEKVFYRKKGIVNNISLRFVIVIILLGLLIITIGYSILKSNGYPQRAKLEYKNLVENPALYHVDHFGGKDYPLEGRIGYAQGNMKAIFIGDSFAHHLSSGLDLELKEEKEFVEVIFQHGCLFSPIARISEGDSALCKSNIEKLKQLTAGNNYPVVLSESWLHYPGIMQDNNGTKITFSMQYTYEQFTSDNLTALHEIIGLDRPMFVVGNPAGSGSQSGVIGCLSRPDFFNLQCEKDLVIPLTKAAGYGFNDFLKKYSNEHKNTFYLDMYKPFCNNEVCYAMDMNTKQIWYSDGGHFSIEGSKKISKEILDQIEKDIKGN